MLDLDLQYRSILKIWKRFNDVIYIQEFQTFGTLQGFTLHA